MTIDLAAISAPEIIDPLSFEAILAARKARFIELAPDMAPVMDLESEPAVKLLEEASYDELLLRDRINLAAQAVMLAYATGNALEHLAALYGVTRLVTDPGNPDAIPPLLPRLETDTALRARVQMAPEGFSTAGPAGAYRFHALSASGEVADASVVTPAPGHILVTILGTSGDGTPSPVALSAVESALNAEDIRPLTDNVSVQAAGIIPYAIEATLTLYPGPSAGPVLALAQSAAAAYANQTHRLGYDVTLSGLYAALHQPGVQRVSLIQPAANIVCDRHQASYCTAVAITLAGTDV